jgi:hypothetical protein
VGVGSIYKPESISRDFFSVYLMKNGVVISHNYRDKVDNRLLASVKIKDCQALSSKE